MGYDNACHERPISNALSAMATQPIFPVTQESPTTLSSAKRKATVALKRVARPLVENSGNRGFRSVLVAIVTMSVLVTFVAFGVILASIPLSAAADLFRFENFTEGATAADSSMAMYQELSESELPPLPPYELGLANGSRVERHFVKTNAAPRAGCRLIEENVAASHDAAASVVDLASRQDLEAGEGAQEKVRSLLVTDFLLPHTIVDVMSPEQQEDLLWKLRYISILRPRVLPRVLFIHSQNGLGNRLRAMAGGVALAKATGRVPVVIWERDAHLEASFSDLFVLNERNRSVGARARPQSEFGRTAGVISRDSFLSNAIPNSMSPSSEAVLYRDFILLDRFPEWSDLVSLESDSWYGVNQMQKEIESEKRASRIAFIQPPAKSLGPCDGGQDTPKNVGHIIAPEQHLYIKTAYVPLTVPKSLMHEAEINSLVRRLVPNAAVQAIVDKHMPSEIHMAVGVHVRSRSIARDNVQVDSDCEYSTKGADLTNYWRSQSQVGVFLEKMIRYRTRNPGIHFFAATDDFKVIDVLARAFPGRVAFIPRSCDDRSPECVQYALADLMCLGRTRKILGSNWSSFSEAAARLTGGPLYMSGVHFGRSVTKKRSIWLWQAIRRLRTPLSALSPSAFSKCRSKGWGIGDFFDSLRAGTDEEPVGDGGVGLSSESHETVDENGVDDERRRRR